MATKATKVGFHKTTLPSLHPKTELYIRVDSHMVVEATHVYKVTLKFLGQESQYSWNSHSELLVIVTMGKERDKAREFVGVNQMLLPKQLSYDESKMISVSADNIIAWQDRHQRFTRRQKNHLLHELRAVIESEIIEINLRLLNRA